MSKLNINNIDVQRILNVLNELHHKLEICSFLTFKTYENIQKNIALLQDKIQNEEFFQDLDDHFAKMSSFYEEKIIIQEEEKEQEKNQNREDEILDDEDAQEKNQEVAQKKERKELIGIEESSSDAVTSQLAKSTRNFCRKYYKEIEILKNLKMFRVDPEIILFMKKFEDNFLAYFVKKSQMTLEEEISEKTLNATLRAKILELELQFKMKTEKYQKLKKERQEFKTRSQNELDDMDNEIQKLRENTKNDLDSMANKVNKQLNDHHEINEKNIKELKEKLKLATDEFEKKKEEDEKDENAAALNYDRIEKQLAVTINEYDYTLKNHKMRYEDLKNEEEIVKLELGNNKKRIEIAEDKYRVIKENFLKTQEKMKQLQYENQVKIRASEWIQGQIRGFFTRKQLRKKYKFLGALKIDKRPVEDPKDAKNKNKGKGKGGRK